MLKSFMVSHRLWQSPVTPIIRSPYLAPTPTPCPKPHSQGHQRPLCSFPMVTYCPHLTWHLRNMNRIDSCPFSRTLLSCFPLSAFTPHHSLFLLLFRLTEYWRTCISQGSILGFFFFLLPSSDNFIFPWLPNIFLQPKSLLCVPNTTTYLTFPLG